MTIRGEEMPAIATLHCPFCCGTFTVGQKEFVPLKVRDLEIDVIAICPICGAICGTTVKRKENI